ncbi:MAG: ferredoxin--NADP+ reductase, partial [Planctomycetota bacterium]
ESDSKLNVEGEDLAGVYAATDFVGWYNGHPDHRHHQFDLHNAKRVALVGNGNVAMDVARILLASPDELAKTDIAEHSLETLRNSTVEEVVLLGRRGPAQAAFSPKEIAEIAALPDVDVVVTKKDAVLDELSAAWLEKDGARSQQRNADFCTKQAELGEGEQPNKLRCRFLVSPTALQGENGKLTAVSIDHMQLQADDSGTPRPRPTGESEQVPVDLLFKAIGYRGEPVPGVPFEERKGIVPNVAGRVVEQLGGDVRVGHYAAGWCKRGPTGLIGTNSLDAKDTVVGMKADFEAQKLLSPSKDDIAPLLAERSIDAVTWADWQRLDEWERKEGESRGKLRHKLSSIEELMTVIADLRTK